MMFNAYSGWGFMGGIWMILWWAFLVLGVIALVRWIANESRSGRGKSAREILEERYARGEISKEEFNEKRRDLSRT